MRVGEWIRLPDGTVMHVDYFRAARRKRRNVAEKLTWPATRKALYAAGYGRAMAIAARPCKRCGKRIEFWKTPAGGLMPLEVNPDKSGEMLCHFETCPHAAEFRKPEHKARPIQKELFPGIF